MRLLHAADLHLDSPFRGLSAEKAKERRRESRDILDRLANLANAREVDAVLLAGDLFDGAHVYRETLEAMARSLGSIRCPVFIAPGNHDPYTLRGPYRQMNWPENVHLFTESRINEFSIPSGIIYGAAFPAEEQPESLLAGFAAPPSDRPQVLCLHADLNPGPYDPITKEEIAGSGLTYLALGHIHQASGLQRQGNTFYAYPGCPEGRGFDELGEKGVLLVEAEMGKVTAEFVPLCRRRYEVVTVDVTDADPRQRLEAAVAPFSVADILRVVFTGETGEAGVDLPALETAFAHRFYSLELRDRTRVGADIWKRAGEDSLRGLFLQDLRRQYEAADSEAEREKIVRAVRFGLAAMDGRDL